MVCGNTLKDNTRCSMAAGSLYHLGGAFETLNMIVIWMK